MAKSYLIQIRRNETEHWQNQTRAKTKQSAEDLKRVWESRGFQVNVVVEK